MPTKKVRKDSTSPPPEAPPGAAKPKKIRAKPIQWDENKNWTHVGINYLISNEKFRRKLFSDSTTDAKDENRRKVQASEGKSILYGELARVIFTDQSIDTSILEEYKADPARFTRSTQQQFARYVTSYSG